MRLTATPAALLLLLAACGDASPSSPTAADIDAIDVTPTHTITVDDEGFVPTSLEVEAGQVVLLVNAGDEPHSFTAADRFDTGWLEPGDDTTLVLTEVGAISFYDLTNPSHEATLTVTAAPAAR